jgi:hypothetical protein
MLPDETGREELTNFYREGNLTIGSMAQISGRDVLATTIYLAATREVGIFSSMGSIEEYEKGLKALTPSKGLVLEPVSIIVMELLHVREKLLDKYGPFYIAQSTLDEFNKTLAMRGIGGEQSGLSIFKEKGEVYKQEISADERKLQHESLQSLIHWLQSYCKIIPVSAALSMNRAKKEEMDQVFHPAMHDSILIAKQLGLPLYTDDARLRASASAQYNISGTWTHCLLKDAVDKNHITQEEYDSLSISLLSFNVHHVPVSSQLLLAAARKSSWSPTYPFLSAIFNLTGWRSNEKSATVVAGEFIYALWIQPIELFNKNGIIIAVLDAITTKRNRELILRNLEGYISQKFRLWPQASDAIVGIMNGWRKARIILH